MKDRASLLGELLCAARPVDQILRDLAAFGWDSDEELVIVTKRHLSEILERYLKGSIAAHAVRAWAEAIEARDDMGLEFGSAQILKQVIFDLANPEITRPLTSLLAQKLLGDLRT